MNKYITRRTFGASATIVLAGCLGSSPDDDDSDNSDPDFNSEVEPDGSLRVSDQEGQGHEIEIDSAEANVDYQIVVKYDGNTVESSIISADQQVSETIELDSQITSEQMVDVYIISTDGEELTSTSFQYTPVPPGPRLTTDNAFEILQDRIGTLGPWPIFEEWKDEPVIESNVNGYSVNFSWIHDYTTVTLDKEATTEENVALANAAFFQALYQSEFVIDEIGAQTFQLRGHDEVGDPVVEQSGSVLVTQSSTDQVNWEKFIDEGEFPEGLRQVADEYEFTFHEPLAE